MDDREIVDLFLERSEQAIVELSHKYGRVCRKVAENVLRNGADAEECVNDAFLAVWNAVPPEKPDPLLSYVLKIVRNLAVKKYRYNSAKKRNGFYDAALDEIADCFPSPYSVEDKIDSDGAARAIDAFLGSLERENRVLFVRRYFYSETVEDLAGLFGTSEHVVSARLYRIRKKLKTHLRKEGIPL